MLDYAAAVDAETLMPVTPLRGTVLLALAVKFGATRLIDNRVGHMLKSETDHFAALIGLRKWSKDANPGYGNRAGR